MTTDITRMAARFFDPASRTSARSVMFQARVRGALTNNRSTTSAATPRMPCATTSAAPMTNAASNSRKRIRGAPPSAGERSSRVGHSERKFSLKH
jgi:hypothetical protein